MRIRRVPRRATRKAETMEEMEAQIAAIHPTPWRAQFDDDGDLVIWFHADLNRDPRRIVVSLDEQPSENELAAAALLVHCREYVTELIGRVRELEAAQKAEAAKDMPDYDDVACKIVDGYYTAIPTDGDKLQEDIASELYHAYDAGKANAQKKAEAANDEGRRPPP